MHRQCIRSSSLSLGANCCCQTGCTQYPGKCIATSWGSSNHPVKKCPSYKGPVVAGKKWWQQKKMTDKLPQKGIMRWLSFLWVQYKYILTSLVFL